MAGSKRKVAYFYDRDIGNYYMGPGHPMKPHRIRMVQSLVLHYGLHNKMEIYNPEPATREDLMAFHSEEYVNFLMTVTPQTQEQFMKQAKMYSMNKDDCPIFEDLYRFCQSYTGGSVGGAVKLNYQSSDCVINWAGGLHHAKRSEASGFCYINDIVLAILELLKYHQRVLYVDIDVHHGDGVEEAFYHTDRVMTVSFHKYGDDFFPGTGDFLEQGHGKGHGYSLNAPLKDGMTDAAYLNLFRPVMKKIMEVYQPEAVVFQSGADSLAGDELGPFNLTVKGHSECLMYMESFKVPMLVLGGGGYTINNVARCWTYETGQLLGEELSDDIPPNEYREYFAPDYKLEIESKHTVDNANSTKYLEELRTNLLQSLSKLTPVPSVQFQERVPDAMSHETLTSSIGALPAVGPQQSNGLASEANLRNGSGTTSEH